MAIEIKTFESYAIAPTSQLPTFGGRIVKKVEPKTFEVLNAMWAKDAKSVYTGSIPLRGINPQTVRALNLAFAVDDAVVASWGGLQKEADVESFRALDAGAIPMYRNTPYAWMVQSYGADRNAVWLYICSMGKAKIVKGADPATFESLEFGFGRDRSAVFFENCRLTSANSSSFVVLDCSFAKDEKNVFYGSHFLKGADAESFEIVDPANWIARDRHGYWKQWERIPEPKSK